MDYRFEAGFDNPSVPAPIAGESPQPFLVDVRGADSDGEVLE